MGPGRGRSLGPERRWCQREPERPADHRHGGRRQQESYEISLQVVAGTKEGSNDQCRRRRHELDADCEHANGNATAEILASHPDCRATYASPAAPADRRTPACRHRCPKEIDVYYAPWSLWSTTPLRPPLPDRHVQRSQTPVRSAGARPSTSRPPADSTNRAPPPRNRNPAHVLT